MYGNQYTLAPKTIAILAKIKILLEKDHAPAPKIFSEPVVRAIRYLEEGKHDPHYYFRRVYEAAKEYGKYRPSLNAILSAQTLETLHEMAKATKAFQAVAEEMEASLESEKLFVYTTQPTKTRKEWHFFPVTIG